MASRSYLKPNIPRDDLLENIIGGGMGGGGDKGGMFKPKPIRWAWGMGNELNPIPKPPEPKPDDGEGLWPKQTPKERAAALRDIQAKDDQRKRNPPKRVNSFGEYYSEIDSGNNNVEFMPKAIGLIDPDTGEHAEGRRYGQLYDERFRQ